MTFAIFPTIGIFNPIYAEYRKGEAPAYASSVPDVWEFFFQEKPKGTIRLKWTMELKEKVKPKLGDENMVWMDSLFDESDDITYGSKDSAGKPYDEYTSMIELAKTEAEYKSKKALILCENDKVPITIHQNIVVTTPQNFIRIVNFVDSLTDDVTKQIPLSGSLLETFLFNKQAREKIEQLTS